MDCSHLKIVFPLRCDKGCWNHQQGGNEHVEEAVAIIAGINSHRSLLTAIFIHADPVSNPTS